MVGKVSGAVSINNPLQKNCEVFPHSLGVGMVFAYQIGEEFNGLDIKRFRLLVASLGDVEHCQIVEAGLLGDLRRGVIVELHQGAIAEGFDGIGFSLRVNKLNLEDIRFVDFNNGSDLTLVEVLLG
jgi:hypothetical protein